MLNEQIELGFGIVSTSRPRRPRAHRAHWWFDQMRALVDHACDWPPAPEPGPVVKAMSAPEPDEVSSRGVGLQPA